jgi:tetratricopeptide (TPR) repeat protein
LENRSASGQASPADERLDSWKEIAAYLKRSVRGVQRWEAEEGMPVHRHRHDKRGTIFAFKPELDAWWRERGAILADRNGDDGAALLSTEREPAVEIETPASLPSIETPEHAKTSAPVPRKSVRAALIGAGFALAVLSVALAAWLSRNGSGRAGSTRPLPFKARDWVLVAGFENRTGETLFDGTVEYVLERELANSRYVNVIPRARVGDVLRLMKKPANTRVDAALGREISVRDGGVRALLTGRTEKLGSKYLLSVNLLDPQTGVVFAGISEVADSQSSIPGSVRELADRVRQVLGERIGEIPVGTAKLENVTTVSLPALQSYSQGMALVNDESWGAAAVLLERAVAQDPEFASAHILLAHCYANLEREEQAAPHFRQAFHLADGATDRERYFIRGSFYGRFIKDLPQAAHAYEALLALYPDDFWSTNNLSNIYRRLGRHEELVELSIKRANLRPRDYQANTIAAQALAIGRGDVGRARAYVARACAVMTPDLREMSPPDATWLDVFPALDEWVSGDSKAALRRIEEVEARIDSLAGRPRDLLASEVAHVYLMLGRLDDADRVFGKVNYPDLRLQGMSRIALLRGDDATLRHSLSRDSLPSLTTAILLARAGFFKEAARLISQPRGTEPLRLSILRGELALERGRRGEALALLENNLEQVETLDTGRSAFLLGSESLAAILRSNGDLPGAIRVLERTSSRRISISEFLWARNRFQLARLYREIGRVGDAERIEDELLNILATADSDHPIVLEIKRLGARGNGLSGQS